MNSVNSTPKSIPSAKLLGIPVAAINMRGAISLCADALREGRKGFICVTGVHGVMEAQSDESLKGIFNQSFFNTPDGMPTVWIGWIQGHPDMDRVYGPDFQLEICQESPARGWTHFLYGGNPGVAEDLKRNLEGRFPGIKIVGTYTPPFRPLNPEEREALRLQVAACKPDFFWVGLSTPKQERFMAEYIH